LIFPPHDFIPAKIHWRASTGTIWVASLIPRKGRKHFLIVFSSLPHPPPLRNSCVYYPQLIANSFLVFSPRPDRCPTIFLVSSCLRGVADLCAPDSFSPRITFFSRTLWADFSLVISFPRPWSRPTLPLSSGLSLFPFFLLRRPPFTAPLSASPRA